MTQISSSAWGQAKPYNTFNGVEVRVTTTGRFAAQIGDRFEAFTTLAALQKQIADNTAVTGKKVEVITSLPREVYESDHEISKVTLNGVRTSRAYAGGPYSNVYTRVGSPYTTPESQVLYKADPVLEEAYEVLKNDYKAAVKAYNTGLKALRDRWPTWDPAELRKEIVGE